MIMLTSKAFYILPLVSTIKSSMNSTMVDPFLSLVEDCRLQAVKCNADSLVAYGSKEDESASAISLSEIIISDKQSRESMASVIVNELGDLSNLESSAIRTQLLKDFLPDDLCPLGAQFFELPGQTLFGKDHKSLDKVKSSTFSLEDDVSTETSKILADAASNLHIGSNLLSVKQLLESVTEKYMQVGRISVSSPDISFKEMTSHCEALHKAKLRKLSVFVAAQQMLEVSHCAYNTKQSAYTCRNELHMNGENPNACPDFHDQSLLLRLPASRPYDNFLKAAGIEGF